MLFLFWVCGVIFNVIALTIAYHFVQKLTYSDFWDFVGDILIPIMGLMGIIFGGYATLVYLILTMMGLIALITFIITQKSIIPLIERCIKNLRA